MAINNTVTLIGNMGDEAHIIETDTTTFAAVSIATADTYQDDNLITAVICVAAARDIDAADHAKSPVRYDPQPLPSAHENKMLRSRVCVFS